MFLQRGYMYIVIDLNWILLFSEFTFIFYKLILNAEIAFPIQEKDGRTLKLAYKEINILVWIISTNSKIKEYKLKK